MDDKKEGMNNTAPQAVVDTAKGAKELAGNTLSGAVSGLTRKQPTRKRQKSKSVSGPTKRGSSKRRTSTSATAKRGSPKRRAPARQRKRPRPKGLRAKLLKLVEPRPQNRAELQLKPTNFRIYGPLRMNYWKKSH